MHPPRYMSAPTTSDDQISSSWYPVWVSDEPEGF
jgi:hypothetical protein